MLGLLHVQVARADDHVDPLDGVGAVGECRDRLRAAHAVDALDAAQPAGAEDERVDLPVGARRRADGDVEHAGGARGDDAHDDRARVSGAPAGDIHGGRADGDLAQHDALALRKLDAGVVADAGVGDERDVGDRDLQPRDQLEREPFDRLVQLRGRDAQRQRLVAGGVEAARVVDDGGVAVGAHSGDDLAHLLGNGVAVGRRARARARRRRRARRAAVPRRR